MEIKTKGRLKTEDELRDEIIDELIETMESYLTDSEALDLGNAYRKANRDAVLYVNDEDNINSELSGRDPYDLLQMAYGWNESDDYFSCDNWGELGSTNDVWSGVDLEDLADDLLDGAYSSVVPDDIREILDDYDEALEKLNNYNAGRALAEEVISKYVNCQADVTDLLQILDKLARTDEYWKEEE